MLKFNTKQMEAFGKPHWDRFVNELMNGLHARFTNWRSVEHMVLRAFVEESLDWGKEYNLVTEAALSTFVFTVAEYKPERPLAAHLLEILSGDDSSDKKRAEQFHLSLSAGISQMKKIEKLTR